MKGQLVALNPATPPTQKWLKWARPLETSSTPPSIYGTPAIGQKYVYVAAYNGKVYAYGIDSGDLHNSVYLDENNPKPIIGGPLAALGNVYIGSSDGKVYALDGETFQPLWKQPFATSNKIWSTPAADKNTVYITSFDKQLYALDANSGLKKWSFTADGALVASPVIYNNTIYFGSIDRHVYAVNAQDGTLKWKSSVVAGKWFWTSVIANNGIIYAPSLDGKVYILNADTGAEMQKAIDLNDPISSQPVLEGNTAIFATEKGQIYAIDTTTSAQKWHNDLNQNNTPHSVNAPLAAGDGIVLVHTEDIDAIYEINATTGIKQDPFQLNDKDLQAQAQLK